MGLINRNRLELPGLLLLVVALAAGCAGPTTEATADQADEASEAQYAPEFTLPDIDGNEVSLALTAGKVRLIDFWATWCPPCRDEVPMLNELSETYRDQGFEILAISDENQKVISKFAEEYDVKYTNLVGTERVAEKYIVLGLPAAYLIDGEGRIVESFLGPKPRKVLEAKIRELLELPPQT